MDPDGRRRGQPAIERPPRRRRRQAGRRGGAGHVHDATRSYADMAFKPLLAWLFRWNELLPPL